MQASTALTVAAVVPIYLGSSASVKPPPRKPVRKAIDRDGADADDEDTSDSDDEYDDRLTKEDAYLFPVLGSLVLVALYLLFKYVPHSVLETLLAAYFSLVSAAALARPFHAILSGTLPISFTHRIPRYRLSLIRSDPTSVRSKSRPKSFASKTLFKASFTGLNIGAAGLGLGLAGYEWWTRDWYLTDLIAECLAFNAIALLKLDGFKTGAILLGGLFWYDVYWVFGSSKTFGESVMVAVAKNMDAPVKITWPKSLSHFCSPTKADLALLGLGDIVIPGIFVALSLRYDYHLACEKLATENIIAVGGGSSSATQQQAKNTIEVNSKEVREKFKKLAASGDYPKPYFKTCLTAYVIGLATTMSVMHFFKSAQPALLYLSPACVGSVSWLAWSRQEWSSFWSWQDGGSDATSTPSTSQVKEKGQETTKSSSGSSHEDDEGLRSASGGGDNSRQNELKGGGGLRVPTEQGVDDHRKLLSGDERAGLVHHSESSTPLPPAEIQQSQPHSHQQIEPQLREESQHHHQQQQQQQQHHQQTSEAEDDGWTSAEASSSFNDHLTKS